MNKLFRTITARPKTVVILFFIATIICAILGNFVSVNYDINSYLPKDSPSTVSLDKMNAEFAGGIPNVRVMIRNVTVPQAMEYKKQIQAVEGVTDVTWLDDSVDIYAPLEVADSDAVESYYQDGAALYSVTLEEEHILDGVEAIRKIIGEDNAMCGSAVSTAVATNSTVSEVRLITVIAIAFVLFILILTTDSWAEPFVILAGIGVAVLLNRGTNLMFGEISFVSNAAGTILQLAVSLDYFVFLLQRFQECIHEYGDQREAMTVALCRSAGSILSSGLTTVIGFVALCLMRFRIGPDLGIVLAKGVVLSLICVFVFMPNLILLVHKLLDRTKHKGFLPSFEKFGKCISKIMVPFACLLSILVIPAFLASNANSYYIGDSHIFHEDTQIGKDTAAIEDIFGKSDTYVLMVPKGDRQKQLALSDTLKKLPQVKDILSYVDTVGEEIPEGYLDPETHDKLISEHYSRMVIQLDTDYEGDSTFALVENIRNTAQSFYDESYLAGKGVSTYDLMQVVTSDMLKVNFIAIGAVFVVLLLSLKSIILPIILVLSIETAIWINLSIPYFADQTIFYIAYLIISSIQLGATVDYAILMTDRYLENRKEMPKMQAIQKTLSSCSVSILTSASIMTVMGFLLGIFSTHGLLAQLGIFLGRGTICSLAIVMLALPGLLYLFDGIIRKTTKNTHFYGG